MSGEAAAGAGPAVETERQEEAAHGVLGQVRAVLSLRGATSALVSGSLVLAGRACGCLTGAVRWAWAQASADPEARAAAEAHAEKAAAIREQWAKDGKTGTPGETKALTGLGAAPSGRRPALEALGLLALGGVLAAGAVATSAAMLAPHLAVLAEWRPVIITAGGAAWSIAALMVAPPPKPPAPKDQEEEDQDDGADGADREDDRGTALLWHVLGALASAESAGRVGLHLDAVLDSATEAGLLPDDTELPVFRSWVEACGLPVADQVGYRIAGKPVTRTGFKLAAVTEALGTTPAALLAARAQTPAGGALQTPAVPVGETPAETPAGPVGETPVQTPVQTPAEAPAGAPVPAALRLISGGRQTPDAAPSPALSQGLAQEAR
ncbi:hypothetical protein [Streptomyces sp. NPDC059783]|uniref:hypothetical protein n=1 Tax=Streptomyces sp. NPDC059783 TaxID=3346944 RepID=UPI00364B4936